MQKPTEKPLKFARMSLHRAEISIMGMLRLMFDFEKFLLYIHVVRKYFHEVHAPVHVHTYG